MKRIVLALLVLSFLTSTADAWPRWRRYRRTRTTYSTSYNTARWSAYQKASRMAALGYMSHGVGPLCGPYEGVGMGTTPQAALNNCCYTGQRVCIDSAVVRGANGMYFAAKGFR